MASNMKILVKLLLKICHCVHFSRFRSHNVVCNELTEVKVILVLLVVLYSTSTHDETDPQPKNLAAFKQDGVTKSDEIHFNILYNCSIEMLRICNTTLIHLFAVADMKHL